MLRMSCIAILAGTVCLAYSAVPESSAQLRLERIVGINLESDPAARALNTDAVASRPIKTQTRSAFQVFGLGSQKTNRAPSPTARATVRVASLDQAKPTSSELPAPTRNPWHLARKITTVALTSSQSLGNEAQSNTDTTAIADAAPPAVKSTTPDDATTTDAATMYVANDLPPASPSSSRELEKPDVPALSRREQRRLARNIQRELTRVGCYRGVVDGVWGRNSRKALRAFADSMSAAIPLDEPSYVALMLVETYDARACAKRESAPETILASNVQQAETASQAELGDQVAQVQFVSRIEVQSLPGANPRRARGSTIAPDQKRQIVASSRSKPRLRPRVAGSTIRKQTSSSLTKLTRLQTDKEVNEAKPETRAASSEQAEPARAKRRITQRRKSRVRRRAVRRAQRKARVRAYKQRAKRSRVVRKRRTKRRSYGFKRRGRPWVRRAFTQRG